MRLPYRPTWWTLVGAGFLIPAAHNIPILHDALLIALFTAWGVVIRDALLPKPQRWIQ